MGALAGLVDKGLMAPDWAEALAPVDDQVAEMGRFLREEAIAGRPFQPDRDAVFRAFRRPLAEVRVLVVGQDPYPNPRHPVGLAFAVARDVTPLPGSLRNIYRELHDGLGIEPPPHGDLSAWADNGVMLLNRVLTVEPGRPNSHRGKGWEPVTARAITALAERGGPRAAILWGNPARKLRPLLGPVPCVESSHPSPLSARHSFFGSRPFSRVDALLREQGGEPVDWTLEQS